MSHPTAIAMPGSDGLVRPHLRGILAAARGSTSIWQIEGLGCAKLASSWWLCPTRKCVALT
jgi:hypothetical protein